MKKIILTSVVLSLLYAAVAPAQGVKPFLQKMLSNLPDNYGIKITYITGKEETFELASHTFTKETGLFEFVTKDDIWNWVPLSSVQRIEFDKRFSKIMSEKEKELQKQMDQAGQRKEK